MSNSSCVRILVIGWFDFPFGSASASRVRHIAKGLKEYGANVRVLTTCSRVQAPASGQRENDNQFVWNGIPYKSVNTSGSKSKSDRIARLIRHVRSIWRSWIEVRRQLKKNDCDAIYAYGISAFSFFPIVVFARLAAVPVVFDISEWFSASRFPFGWLDLRFWDQFLGRQLPRLFQNRVVAISSFIQEKYDSYGVPCVLIPSLFDVSGILSDAPPQPTDAPPRPTKESDIQEFVVLYAGNCKRTDGVEHLLQAIITIAKLGHEIRLDIVGTDGKSGEATAVYLYCKENPLLRSRVSFLGRLPDAEYPSALKRADCLVLPRPDIPAVRAAFPTRLPEFLATGIPVITSNVPDVPRYIESHKHAVLYDNYCGNSLADAILEVILNPNKACRIGLAGQKCCSKFDYKKHAKKLYAFIDLSSYKSGNSRVNL